MLFEVEQRKGFYITLKIEICSDMSFNVNRLALKQKKGAGSQVFFKANELASFYNYNL